MSSSSVIESSPEVGHVVQVSGAPQAPFSWLTPRNHGPNMRLLSNTLRATGVFHYSIQSRIPPDLEEALDDLDGVAQESLEEGLDIPSSEAMANAERVLLLMYGLKRYRYEVYPATERAVIVDCPHDKGSVMAMCEANGEILLFMNAKGNQESERVPSIDDEDRVRAILGRYLSSSRVIS